ncbi:MAG: carboxypeptidase regulatory-like domain-containing protein [Vicinamibacterales bacterium]
MKLALIATLPLVLLMPVDAGAQRKPAAAPTATTTATITVTDLSGAPIPDVRVTLTGSLDRSGSTQTNGTVKFDGLRQGVYRLRFMKDDFMTLERELEWRAGQPAPIPSVALSPASKPATPPPPEPSKDAAMPPPGKPVSVSLPDFIEKNYITNTQPQKVSVVGCGGLAQNVLWQIREPWENRQHADADAMLYVIGGDGTLRLDGRDTPMAAGHFASVPRGMSYSLIRRGRNPLIVLATLVGEPCAP